MKKGISTFFLSMMMLMVIVGIGAQDADKYAVKAPIKIQFWHALGVQYSH